MEHLDGNAIGGDLLELFGVETTIASGVCGSCGSRRMVAELHVYVRAPGTVVRCPGCDAVLMRIVRGGGRTWVDLSGLRVLELPRPDMIAVALDQQEGLVSALRDGDEATFAALVAELGPSMLRVARMYVSTAAVAEEVVQEAWLGLLTGIDRFEGRSSLKTWLYRILVNTAKTRGEREARTIPLASLTPEAEGDEPAVEPERFMEAGRWTGHWTSAPSRWSDVPEARLLSAEIRAVIEQAIAALPPSQRTVISLRDVEGWGSQEVCNLLDISETNQRVLLHRARSGVRRALERYMDESESR